MGDLISKSALKAVKFHPLPYTHIVPTDAAAESYKWGWNDAIDAIIESAPTIDAVPVGAYEQTRWERDMAISQLAEIGKSLCEKMDNVATVVRCKECKRHNAKAGKLYRCDLLNVWYDGDFFCANGERSEE